MSEIKYLSPLNECYINQKYAKFGFTEKISVNSFLPIKLENIDISIANALRRICMAEIPTVAFGPDDITILANTSQYHCEVLVDRFGFIVIDMTYLEDQQIDEKDLVFTLCNPQKKEEPLRNTSQSIWKVFIHEHLQVSLKNEKSLDITKICPLNSLLMTLNPKEEIYVVMTPSLDIGRHHPRWQCSITMYKFGTSSDEKIEGHIDTNKEQLNYIGREMKKPKTILLTIESIQKLPSIMVLKRGIGALKKKLTNVKNAIQEGPKSGKVTIFTGEVPNLSRFKILDEDHTMGNVLEYACLDRIMKYARAYVEENFDSISKEDIDKRILSLITESLSGYKKNHPLENEIELVIRIPSKLSFTKTDYDEFDPSVRVVLFAIDKMVKLCDQLSVEADLIK